MKRPPRVFLVERMEYQMAHSGIAIAFMADMLLDPNAFLPFYKHVKKQFCQEVFDFLLISEEYKSQPTAVRKALEQKIYSEFVSSKSQQQINLPEKLRTQIQNSLGFGKYNIFENAQAHCAEMLGSNYWMEWKKRPGRNPTVI